jgi:hypothetical protein
LQLVHLLVRASIHLALHLFPMSKAVPAMQMPARCGFFAKSDGHQF